jgi:hypothetical protein
VIQIHGDRGADNYGSDVLNQLHFEHCPALLHKPQELSARVECNTLAAVRKYGTETYNSVTIRINTNFIVNLDNPATILGRLRHSVVLNHETRLYAIEVLAIASTEVSFPGFNENVTTYCIQI